MTPSRLGSCLLISLSLVTACNKRREAADGIRADERRVAIAVDKPAEPADRPMADRPMAGSAKAPTSANTEQYVDHGKNPWIDTRADHRSTFAADVDTASYTLARRKLNEHLMPEPAGIRPEEFVNYFHYRFAQPAKDARSPFVVALDAAPSPFDHARSILRVGVATPAKSVEDRKPANLVFLVDVSGSMEAPDRIGLVRTSLERLVRNLTAKDSVAIVTYAGDSRVVLPATRADRVDTIVDAIRALHTGGSTAMGSGLDLAYAQAMKGLAPDAISRVIVLTDGDANVGAHGHAELLSIIKARAAEGITLSTIGFGVGNYHDEDLEQLADRGNGNHYYLDSDAAAAKVFGTQLGATLEVAAKDVKLQVDFDPELVARYRLLGYEDRDVADRDFRNDRVDAGQVGAGHQVTALYELELQPAGEHAHAPLASVHVRYKPPVGSEVATEETFPMPGARAETFAQASDDLRFAFAVAAFADVLRDNPDARAWSLTSIEDLARNAAGDDPDRLELVDLIRKARVLAPARAASR